MPVMHVQPKLHKPTMENGDPKTRAIVAAACDMTARAGDLLADVLDSVVLSGAKQEEALSTEDVLSALEDTATKVNEEGERVVVSSINVVGLYPNLNPERAARQCNDELIESQIEHQR